MYCIIILYVFFLVYQYPQQFQLHRQMAPTQVQMSAPAQPAATNIVVSNAQPQGQTAKAKVRRKHALQVIDPNTGTEKYISLLNV